MTKFNLLAILFTIVLAGCLHDEEPVTVDPAFKVGTVDCRTGGDGQGVCDECGRNGGAFDCCGAIEAQGLYCEVLCDPGAGIPDPKGIITGCRW